MRRTFNIAVVVAAALLLTDARVVGSQTVVTTKPQPGWVMPRLPDGRPDLEGVWENNVATPLERPRQLADKPLLSESELAVLVQRARERFGADAEATFGDTFYSILVADSTPTGLGATGTYSQNWLPDRYFEHRTSLIVDPPDGRLPPVRPEAATAFAAAAAARQRHPESARDFSLPNRCVSFGFPDLFAAYMSVYRIVQTPEYVAIAMEKIHDARIIPIDSARTGGGSPGDHSSAGSAHLPAVIRQYMGDSRGHWDGDTLVVETTNFHANGNPMGGLFNRASPNMNLTERFRRTGADILEYTFTVDDPTVWTKPWTAMIPWRRTSGEVLEYACHEGNYSLSGMLSGARADEANGR